MTPAQIAATLARLSDDELRSALRTLPRSAIDQLLEDLRVQEPGTASRLIGLLPQEHLREIFCRNHDAFLAKVRPTAQELCRFAFKNCDGWEPALVALEIAKRAMIHALTESVPESKAAGVLNRVNVILAHAEVQTFEVPSGPFTRLDPKTKVEA